MEESRLSVGDRMSRAARELEDEGDLQATMDTAVRLAAENVRGCDLVAISILSRDGIDTPAYTARAALEADLLQYSLGEGPCLDAARGEPVVHSPDIAADPRWKEWGTRVAGEHGAHSVLCLQLFTSGHALGALNHYSVDRDSFSAQDREDALALAAHIAVAIADAQTAAQLLTALDTRTVIGQPSVSSWNATDSTPLPPSRCSPVSAPIPTPRSATSLPNSSPRECCTSGRSPQPARLSRAGR